MLKDLSPGALRNLHAIRCKLAETYGIELTPAQLEESIAADAARNLVFEEAMILELANDTRSFVAFADRMCNRGVRTVYVHKPVEVRIGVSHGTAVFLTLAGFAAGVTYSMFFLG